MYINRRQRRGTRLIKRFDMKIKLKSIEENNQIVSNIADSFEIKAYTVNFSWQLNQTILHGSTVISEHTIQDMTIQDILDHITNQIKTEADEQIKIETPN